MKRYLALLISLLILTGTAAAIPPPIHVYFTTECDGPAFQVKVWVENWSGEEVTMDVVRTQTAPDMLGAEPLIESALVPENQQFSLVLTDPGVGPGDLGYFEATIYWLDGTEYGTFTDVLSCSEDPFLMRGWLNTDSQFEPCTGLELLECDTVTLHYVDLLQYVGTGELLEIYGWPEYLDERDDCWVQVESIVSLGIGTSCEDPVGLESTTWSSLKARYRQVIR